jgi:ABC-type amino acid transport substrate-binding protein
MSCWRLVNLALWVPVTVQAATRLANLNWITADLSNHAFVAELNEKYSSSDTVLDLEISAIEFDSSEAALSGLTDGTTDIVLECWNDTSSLCDRTPNTTAFPSGAIGRTHLYIPDYLEAKYPLLKENGLRALEDESYVPPAFEILGSVTTWSETQIMQQFFDDPANGVLHLSSRIQTFPTAAALNMAVLRRIRERKGFVFLYWEPDVLSSIAYYKILPITLRHDNWRKAFPDTTIMVVHREVPEFYRKKLHKRLCFSDETSALSEQTRHQTHLGAPEGARVWGTRHGEHCFIEKSYYQLSNSNLTLMISMFSKKASPQLGEEDNPTYSTAVQRAAKQFTCERLEVDTCDDESRWPREKPGSWPDKLVVWVKGCPGFVGDDTLAQSDVCQDLSRPANNNMIGNTKLYGYSIEHVKKTASLLGYSERDLVFRCGPGTGWLVKHTSHNLADLGLACITITDSRIDQIDFSTPYFHTGYKLLVNANRNRLEREARGVTSVLLFTLPFTRSAWIVIMSLLVFVAIVLLYLEHDAEIIDFLQDKGRKLAHAGSPQHRTNPSSVSETVTPGEAALRRSKTTARGRCTEFVRVIQYMLIHTMNAIAIVIGGRDGVLEQFKTPMARFIGNASLICGIWIMALYTANLAAFMTVQNMAQDIMSLDDLKQRTGPIAIQCPVDKPLEENWEHNFITQYLYQYHSDLFKRAVCYESRKEMAEGVRSMEAIAAFDDAGILDFIAEKSNCELETVGNLFGLQEYGYVFPKHSKLRDPFSSAIAETRASQWTKDLESKYFKENSEKCKISNGVDTNQIDEGPFVGIATLLLAISLSAAVSREWLRRQDRTLAAMAKTRDHIAQTALTTSRRASSSLSRLSSKDSASSNRRAASQDPAQPREPTADRTQSTDRPRVPAEEANPPSSESSVHHV